MVDATYVACLSAGIKHTHAHAHAHAFAHTYTYTCCPLVRTHNVQRHTISSVNRRGMIKHRLTNHNQ